MTSHYARPRVRPTAKCRHDEPNYYSNMGKRSVAMRVAGRDYYAQLGKLSGLARAAKRTVRAIEPAR